MALVLVSLVQVCLVLDFVGIKWVDSAFLQGAGGTERDMVATNMFKIYEKFSKEPHRHRDDNTVRSFRALSGKSHFLHTPTSPGTEYIYSYLGFDILKNLKSINT